MITIEFSGMRKRIKKSFGDVVSAYKFYVTMFNQRRSPYFVTRDEQSIEAERLAINAVLRQA